MRHHQIAENIAGLAGVQGVALTDHVGVPLASCGVDSAVAERLGAAGFLLWRLAEQCSGIIDAGRVEWAVLQPQRGSLLIVACNDTHLVVLADDSIPIEDLTEQIIMITQPRSISGTIPHQDPGHDH